MFLEMSDGNFAWGSALTSPGGAPVAFTGPGGLPLSYSETTDRANLFVKMKEAGFDFRPYDTNGDRIITPRELIVLPVVNGGGLRNGQHTSYSSVVNYEGTNYTISTSVAFCGFETDFYTAAHELAHCLGCIDLYNNAFGTTTGSMNNHLSLMSDPDVHIDAWHRMMLGWTKPRVVSLEHIYPGYARIDAPQRTGGIFGGFFPGNTPLIFHDPARDTADARRFFMLEARSNNVPSSLLRNPSWPAGGYDAQAPGSGGVFWYLETKPDTTAHVEDFIHPGAANVLQSTAAGDDYFSAGAILGGANRISNTTLLGNDYLSSMFLVCATPTPGDLLSRYGYAPDLGLAGTLIGYHQPRWRAPADPLPVRFRLNPSGEWPFYIGNGLVSNSLAVKVANSYLDGMLALGLPNVPGVYQQDADYDGDTIPNGVEFALGTNAALASEGAASIIHFNDGAGFFRFRWREQISRRTCMEVYAETSADLESWTPQPAFDTGAPTDPGFAIMQAAVDLAGQRRLFFRLKAKLRAP